MDKIIIRLWIIVTTAFVSLNLASCGDDDSNTPGSIYGIVTELGSAEPMKAVGIELYKGDKLLLKTVTFDDGHFEFDELSPGDYKVTTVADGYETTEGEVVVEAGRQARIDLQIKKLVFKHHMVVRTIEPEFLGSKVTLSGEYTFEEGGDYAPTEVGFVYDTQNNPKDGGTLIRCRVNNGTKSFSATLDELARGTYYVQAYAKNRVGTEYGEVRSFIISGTTVVQTLAATDVSSGTATLNGKIASKGNPAYSEKGFCYNTSGEPTISNTKVRVSGTDEGEFSYSCVGLSPNTTYFVRAYAIQGGDVHYGTTVSFNTDLNTTRVSTSGATNVSSSSATLNGTIIEVGSPAYSEKGFCYSTSPDPTVSNTKITVSGNGAGNFSANVNGLAYNTTYYVRAYAIQNGNVCYGTTVTFSTQWTSTAVSTSGATNVTPSSATLNGSITEVGSPAYSEKGFCYSTFPNPTISNTKKVVSGTGAGNYTSSVNGLSFNTTYYYKAYAIQNGTPIYGSEVSFNTGYTVAVVETSSNASDIKYDNAKVAFTIKNMGDPACTEAGICYGTSSNPTIYSNKVVGSISTYLQKLTVSGLQENTTYYYRAYVMQNGDAVYGGTFSFKTAAHPSVSTLAVSNLQNPYGLMDMWQVQLNGYVNSVGSPVINGRGFKYSTNGDPESYGTVASASGSSAGSFSTSLTRLRSNTTYYVRAYVKNSLGYEYGDLITFTTGN